MYPYRSYYQNPGYQDPGKEFLGALIPALIIYFIVVGIVLLVKYGGRGSRKERPESEGSALGYYLATGFAEFLKFAYFIITRIFKLIGFILKLIFVKIPSFIYKLSSKKPADSSRMSREDLHFEDKEKESNKDMDEYHV